MKKNRLLVFPITAAIFLSSCGIKIEKNENIIPRKTEVATTTFVVEEKEYEEIPIRVTYIKPDVVEDDSIFYQREFNKSATYEDIVLTLEEKGYSISDDAINAIRYISDNKVEINNDLTNLLEVNENELLNYNITGRNGIHYKLNYYNSYSDTIMWDELVDVIYNNSKESVEKDLEYKMTDDILYKGYETLTYDDVKIIVNQIREFTYKVKSLYPTYDLAHLSCVLSGLSLLYIDNNDEDNNVFAYYSYGKLVWCKSRDGLYPDLENLASINDHEYKHLLCGNCIDDLMFNGYHIDESGISKYKSYDMSYDFISEATAEEFSANLNNRNRVSYSNQHTILNSIRYVLSLQDDYEEDGFLKYSLLQNPIASFQQFPILDNTKDTYKNNLIMLSSFDKVLTYIPFNYVFKVEEKYGYDTIYDEDMKYKEIFDSLSNYSMGELSRLFFTNLIVLNNNKDLILDYNLYLIKLFEINVYLDYSALSNAQNYFINPDSFYENYKIQLDVFAKYYSNLTNIPYEDIMMEYYKYAIENNESDNSLYNEILSEYFGNIEEDELGWDYYITKNYIKRKF